MTEPSRSSLRLGIFGGSFDPVHYGHLLLAESCREQCRLDRVWLLPAAASPHKLHQRPSDARHRVDMLRLAIGGHAAFEVSTMEIDRGGVSYTVDTLATIHQQHPEAELFLLMGADSLEDLPHWRHPQRICELAIPVVVRRAGSPPPNFDGLRGIVDAERRAQCEAHQVVMPLIDLASSEVRARVSRGESIRYRTPRAVEKYIESNRLYR
jgi:nicotinate-nucleotide adenylyltransferase